MKSKLTSMLCTGLIPVLFGIAFPADAAPKQSSGITYNATLLNIGAPASANGINDVGQIVGQYGTGGDQYGFIYKFTEEPLVTLLTNTLSDGAVNTQAYGINNAGQVVGATATGNDTLGFLYSGGNFTNFSVGTSSSGGVVTYAFGINSGGQIVGEGLAGNYYEGFLYLGSTVEVLKVPGATDTQAGGINSAGEIVGWWLNDTRTRYSGFIYNNGVYTVINFPGSTRTILRGINDLGQILGYYLDASSNAHYFIYENGNFDAITVLLGGQVVLEGQTNTGSVNGINKAGQIVGSLVTSNCNGCAFVADPVVKLKKN
jgi:probable HAF family extracellular repeat protein